MLLIAILMIGRLIYKCIKYSVKVEADITTEFDPISNSHLPIYQYSYKGRIYRYNNGITYRRRILKRKKIRINPRKPNKAYIPYSSITYWIFVFVLLFQGIIFYLIEVYS